MSSESQQTTARYLSLPGLLLMAVGLGMAIVEQTAGMLGGRFGETGRWLTIGTGTLLSIWGLKEIIIGFWPRFSRRGYTFHLPREGMLFLVITCVLLVGSILGGSNTLLMVFSLMVSLWTMNGWFTFTALQRLSVQREHPPRVMSGEPFTVSITLQNRRSWMSVWLMIVEDLIIGGSTELKPHVVFVRLPAKSSQRGHYQAILDDRGRYDLGPITINSRFPLGLVERGVGVTAKSEMLVYPRIGRMRPEWKKRLLHSTELVSQVKPQAGAFNDEMHRIREYRIGDDPRTIHWPTTARKNELMVREFHESRDRDLLIVVDAWIANNSPPSLRDDLERAIRMAATACLEQLRSSRESSLIARLAGEEIYDWRGDTGHAHVDDLLDGFALLRPSATRSPATLLQGLEQGKSRGRVVIVTPRAAAIRQHLSSRTSSATEGLIALGEVTVLGASLKETSPIFDDHWTG